MSCLVAQTVPNRVIGQPAARGGSWQTDAEAVALLRRGLEREIVNPYMYRDWPNEETSEIARGCICP